MHMRVSILDGSCPGLLLVQGFWSDEDYEVGGGKGRDGAAAARRRRAGSAGGQRSSGGAAGSRQPRAPGAYRPRARYRASAPPGMWSLKG